MKKSTGKIDSVIINASTSRDNKIVAQTEGLRVFRTDKSRLEVSYSVYYFFLQIYSKADNDSGDLKSAAGRATTHSNNRKSTVYRCRKLSPGAERSGPKTDTH